MFRIKPFKIIGRACLIHDLQNIPAAGHPGYIEPNFRVTFPFQHNLINILVSMFIRQFPDMFCNTPGRILRPDLNRQVDVFS